MDDLGICCLYKYKKTCICLNRASKRYMYVNCQKNVQVIVLKSPVYASYFTWAIYFYCDYIVIDQLLTRFKPSQKKLIEISIKVAKSKLNSSTDKLVKSTMTFSYSRFFTTIKSSVYSRIGLSSFSVNAVTKILILFLKL